MTARRSKTRTASDTTIGQIGLGIMGGAFAKHLRQGVSNCRFRSRCERRAALERLAVPRRNRLPRSPGVATSSSRRSEHSAVKAFFSGGRDRGKRPPDGTIVIEASTLPMEVKLELSRRSHQARITVLDCPSAAPARRPRQRTFGLRERPEDAVRKCVASRRLRAEPALLRRVR